MCRKPPFERRGAPNERPTLAAGRTESDARHGVDRPLWNERARAARPPRHAFPPRPMRPYDADEFGTLLLKPDGVEWGMEGEMALASLQA